MPFYEKGNVRIRYEEAGKGFPLLVIPGGGLNSTIEWVSKGAPFDAIAEFRNEYRVVCCDLRYAPSGQSSGPLDVERPWDSITDDQLAIMDHVGAKRFMVLGYCIGGPMIWNLIRRAPDRVVAAVLSQPSGWRKEQPNLSYESNMKGWGPDLVKKRPDLNMGMIDKFLTNMYRGPRQDFVYTVSRDFVRSVKTPLLVMPDDSPPHPFSIAMESVLLAPNSEVSIFPWKEPKDRIPIAVRQVRSFLRAHAPLPV